MIRRTIIASVLIAAVLTLNVSTAYSWATGSDEPSVPAVVALVASTVCMLLAVYVYASALYKARSRGKQAPR